MSKNNAIKLGIGYTVGNILLKGVTFLTLPIFSRILTTEEYGLFNTYVAYEMIISVFVGVCLYASLRTAKYDYKDNFEEYSASVLFLSIFIMISALIVINLFYSKIAWVLVFNRTIINVLIVQSYAMFVFQFYNTKLALDFKYKEYLIVTGINTILGTLFSLILIFSIFNNNRGIGRIIGYAVIPIFLAVIIEIRIIKNSIINKKSLINFKMWKYGIIISLPLVVHSLSQQILSQLDRIMIGKINGMSYAGIYGFIYSIVNILQIIALSMDNAWSVWFYEIMNNKEYDLIKTKSNLYITMMNILYMGFICFAPEVIKIMGDSDYWDGIRIVVPLSFSLYFMFLYTLPIHVEYFYKKTKFIAIGTMSAAAINLILNIMFIEKYGYEAAAWTTLVSYIALFIFHIVIVHKIEKAEIFSYKHICKSIVFCSIYSIFILIFLNNIVIRYLILILLLIGIFMKYKNDVISLKNSF